MNEENFYELIKTYKFEANKSLGQNFLINRDVCKLIVSSLDTQKDDKTLEIGAGLGSLSYYLVKEEGEKTLIDVDERMLIFLTNQFGEMENVEVKRENVLKSDLSNYTKIVGNLPYYITSGIIEHILLTAVNAKSVVLMTQKEVYFKLLKEVSPLTLLLKYVSKMELIKEVGRNNFSPVPHVDSLVFKLTPNENIKNPINSRLYKVMNNLFLHRRKTIYNCLGMLVKSKETAKTLLDELKIEENTRPEQITIEKYIELTKLLTDKKLIK